MHGWLYDTSWALVTVAAFSVTYSIFRNYLHFKEYRARPLRMISEADRKLIRNEQAKLSASWTNTIAAGILAAGLVPLVIAAIRTLEGEGEVTWPSVVVAIALTPMAVLLHWVGRILLRGLRS